MHTWLIRKSSTMQDLWAAMSASLVISCNGIEALLQDYTTLHLSLSSHRQQTVGGLQTMRHEKPAIGLAVCGASTEQLQTRRHTTSSMQHATPPANMQQHATCNMQYLLQTCNMQHLLQHATCNICCNMQHAIPAARQSNSM